MNILLSSYSVNPYHGSEDGKAWHWVLELSKRFNNSDDKIYLVTKRYNEKATVKGIAEAGMTNVELVIVDPPDYLNWFKEKHSIFHHGYYMLWQLYAYSWAKKSKIKFDIIHHITMGDFRIPGKMYKFKDAYTIFGPVGGGQSTPKALKCYEDHPAVEKFREYVNKSRAISPKYKRAIRKFDEVYAVNNETVEIISKALGKPCKQLFEISLADEFKYLETPERSSQQRRIVFVGRLIAKKGLMLLLDAVNAIDKELDFVVDIYGDGPLRGQMEAFIKENNLGEKVILHGNVKHTEISSAYMNANIFVMPSLRETGGNVLIEAMAHKLPIVSLDMSISNILKSHECGRFINIHQSKDEIIKEFARSLTELIENDELSKELGENGYEYANAELNWQNKVATIYKGFIND